MKKKTLFILVLATGALFTPVSAAPFEKGPLRGEIAQTLLELRSDLDLTNAQKKEIRNIVEGYRDEIKEQFTTGKTAREEMRSAVQKHGPESPEATAAAEKIGESATSGSLLLANILSDLKPVLTEEQIQKIHSGKSKITDLIEDRLATGSL